MVSRNSIYFGLFLVIFVAVAVAIVLNRAQPQTDKFAGIKTFSDCAGAGYPVMQSYPRQCSLPNGKFFVEQLVAQECRSLNDCPSGFACVNHSCVQLKGQ
jgi:hypothetical protein